MTHPLRRATLALLLAGLSACATSPTGRTQLMLVSEDSAIQASQEAYVSTVGQLKREGKISSDAAINKRVKAITDKLIAQAVRMRPASSHWDWSVVVIDDPDTVNAWCMAGGRMAVYTGLLDKVNPTDDELAEVMAHEISHALANHTAEKMSMAMASQLGVLAIGAASKQSELAMTGAAAAAQLAIGLPNSRVAESEADQIGIELAARAGFNPNAAISLWKKMNQVGGDHPPEFLSTHPDPENRERRLARLAPQMMHYYQDAIGIRSRKP